MVFALFQADQDSLAKILMPKLALVGLAFKFGSKSVLASELELELKSPNWIWNRIRIRSWDLDSKSESESKPSSFIFLSVRPSVRPTVRPTVDYVQYAESAPLKHKCLTSKLVQLQLLLEASSSLKPSVWPTCGRDCCCNGFGFGFGFSFGFGAAQSDSGF